MAKSKSVETVTHGGTRDLQDCARAATGIG